MLQIKYNTFIGPQFEYKNHWHDKNGWTVYSAYTIATGGWFTQGIRQRVDGLISVHDNNGWTVYSVYTTTTGGWFTQRIRQQRVDGLISVLEIELD